MNAESLVLACLLSALPGPPGISFQESYVHLFPVDKTKCPTIDPVRDISYHLYTRNNPLMPDVLRLQDDVALENSHMNFSDPTIIYFHGFLESVTSLSPVTIKTAFLQRKEHNIILLNTPRLEAGPWYLTATRNTRVVGQFTATFIDYLVDKGLNLKTLHLFGTSLGAQMAGVTGSNVRSGRILRITGMDPAGPIFTKLPNSLKLDKGDAEFVDVIHTDAGIFGYPRAVGHVDFWPNQGIGPQPGCMIPAIKKRKPDNNIIELSYLQREKHNIILVSGVRLEAGPWYVTSTRNSYVMGQHTARFIDYLVSRGMNLQNLNLAGVSLGAQIAGITGSNVRSGRVPRITGIDPAGPIFKKLPNSLKLDKGDAEFVDVIHTDAGVFGYPRALGHVDFWPNRGISLQPGCRIPEIKKQLPDNNLIEFFVCSHRRSYQYYAESVINTKGFLSLKCNSWQEYISGKCDPNQKPISMGYGVPLTARGNYYLTTNSKSPFSLQGNPQTLRESKNARDNYYYGTDSNLQENAAIATESEYGLPDNHYPVESASSLQGNLNSDHQSSSEEIAEYSVDKSYDANINSYYNIISALSQVNLQYATNAVDNYIPEKNDIPLQYNVDLQPQLSSEENAQFVANNYSTNINYFDTIINSHPEVPLYKHDK